ncbi:cobaltochelatase subunit CobN [Paenibacillus mesophilus]|uniref:cobaltochelatase subunit CobN n=1 Tax=Paenibacillus mesophilus TaxID=2582849 RepID=UPI00110F19A7|nr:cobaltochelatase subunit CobN [Paenibacillus mesophilus]TMV43199.1 cobaltochelatase subunit CobN [Paenibacillus mesophilus]
MNIAIAAGGEIALAHLSEAYDTFDERQREELELVLIDLGRELAGDWLAEIGEKLAKADLVLFDAHGVRKETVVAISGMLRKLSVQVVPVGSDSAEIRSLLRLGVLAAEDVPIHPVRQADDLPEAKRADYTRYVRLTEYWRGGGPDNMVGLLCLAGREYGGHLSLPVPAEPVFVRELCLFDPTDRRVYGSIAAYRESRGYSGGRPAVALFFLGNGNPTEVAACMEQLMSRIEPIADVLPIAFPSVMNFPMARLRELLFHEESRISLIINTLPFRLGVGPSGEAAAQTPAMLETLGAPVLHPFLLSGTTVDEWQSAVRGLSASQLLVQVMMPELDGCIETYPIAALRREGEDRGLGVNLNKLAAIPERIERLAGRIRRWLELREKPNSDKKLALVCYNYPPSEANVFCGAFLDTFESVSRLLTALREEGYDVEPMSAERLRSRFMDGGLVNSGKWTAETAADAMIRYADPDFSGKLEETSWGQEAILRWGEPPGDVMAEEGSYLIPGIINGNVFIGLQPSRGIHEFPEKSLHDRSILPTHQYTAFYRWIREEMAADAIVHVGTHGTLEFQRGKETGMSGDCVPDYLIGDLPHFYYYYVGNPSEAMIAKRRSHATLIGYQAPPMMEAELYGDWLELEALLHEYREAEQLDPDRCDNIWRKALEIAEALHFVGTEPEELEEELYRMKRSIIPSGLHVLGVGYTHEAAAAHMRFVLRHERGEIRSLRGLLAERKGLDIGSLTDARQTETLRELDAEAMTIADRYLEAKELPVEYADDPPAWRLALTRTLEYGNRAYESSRDNKEMNGLLRALEGKYVPAGLAGDALRSPEVLPSGRNLYQFDPRAVPSPSAAERGATVAENSIRQYRENHGEYPGTTAVVLWGLETSRTQGETIGQIMRYLGVRVKGGRGTFRTEYEIIPLQELGRPRLNVVVHMTGLFRDMFPNLLDDLNVLFRRVSELDESDEDNRFKAHTRQTAEKLRATGHDLDRIADLASARLFGPPEGEYGTTLTRLIETKHWTEEADLGRAYADGQQHVYSLKERGRAEPELFAIHLQAVDIVSQIRSNHEYEVTDSDHYYEYFGGLAKSVELVRGRSAEIHITDTTGERAMTESAEHAIARGVRTRLTNPKWIDASLEHPYHGTQQVARRFEYVLGLAATTGKVEPWVFDSLHATYVEDRERSRQMADNNRWAYHAMIETLLESHQRGYWQPNAETLDRLRRRYIELEGDLEEG